MVIARMPEDRSKTVKNLEWSGVERSGARPGRWLGSRHGHVLGGLPPAISAGAPRASSVSFSVV
eukprot:15600564-Heterocapsa_arctica.AAC.1